MEVATTTSGERVIAWMLTQLVREERPKLIVRPTKLRALLRTHDRETAKVIREEQRREYCKLKMRERRSQQ